MILRRIPGERFSEVVREWAGATVALLGGGPSLTAEQVEKVRVSHQAGRCRAIAVNDAYLWAPWSDVCYFADSSWWKWQTEGRAKPLLGLTAQDVRERFAAFPGQKCSIMWSGMNIADEAVHILKAKNGEDHDTGISLDPRVLAKGRSSGFQALNLAILAGASTVLLLGFDGKSADDGRGHWFGEHPRLTPTAPFYEAMRRAFSAAEREITVADVRVLNCSLGSAIDSFPKVALDDFLRKEVAA